jgi:hypothetical protein
VARAGVYMRSAPLAAPEEGGVRAIYLVHVASHTSTVSVKGNTQTSEWRGSGGGVHAGGSGAVGDAGREQHAGDGDVRGRIAG